MTFVTKPPVAAAVLLLLLLAAPPPGAVAASPELLDRHFVRKLEHRFPLIRTQGLVGLAHLGTPAAAPEVAGVADRAAGFERLLALWTLVRLAPGGSAHAVPGAVAEAEGATLLEGSFYEVAARVAFLAARDVAGADLRLLDRALPRLYTEARQGDAEERLLAAWALHAIGTPVTAATADEALAAVARDLDPGSGRYTRHLLLVRLVGPPAAPILGPRLEDLLRGHDFEISLAPKKALTAFTLAFIRHPQEPPALTAFREELRRDLDRSLYDFGALRGIEALGPFACTPTMVEALRDKVARERDEEERELALENLRMCGGEG